MQYVKAETHLEVSRSVTPHEVALFILLNRKGPRCEEGVNDLLEMIEVFLFNFHEGTLATMTVPVNIKMKKMKPMSPARSLTFTSTPA